MCVLVPYMLAGLGMVTAGLLLQRVQSWAVFRQVPQLFILVPALIGLKGNLEMTLASRLSTQANLGNLDTVAQTLSMGGANLALTQLQGIVVGGLAAGVAIIMSFFTSSTQLTAFGWLELLLMLVASSVTTSSTASFVLGLVMVLVIAVSRRLGINPDNIATPVAAALGDLVTLALLSAAASVLNSSGVVLQASILGLYCLIAYYSKRLAGLSPDTADVLRTGWSPVLNAMLISSVGGIILNRAIKRFNNIALFQPVINGVAGNLVSIQASRLSTAMHRSSNFDEGSSPQHQSADPGDQGCNLINPAYTFSPCSCPSPSLKTNAVAAKALLLLVVPGHIIFNIAIGVSNGFQVFSPLFTILYLVAAIFQVALLLYIANMMVFKMWRMGINPDNAAIPYLTALGDLLGGALLTVVFLAAENS